MTSNYVAIPGYTDTKIQLNNVTVLQWIGIE